jgi:hypothetical protein
VAVRKYAGWMPPDDQFELVEARDAVVRAMASLSPRKRAGVVLMPTVERMDGVRDPTGRPAVRLRFSMDTWGSVSYDFDPTTHLLMGETALDQQQGGGNWVYDMGIVDGTDGQPSGSQWLFPPQG